MIVQQETVSNRYYNQLDGLRFISVFGVLIQHFVHDRMSHFFLVGNAGVDLFFVISGFLITENLLVLKGTHSFGNSIKVFYVRRMLRIFPLYYLYWGILIVFFNDKVLNSIWWGLLYCINFYGIHHPVNKYFGHLWSLSVEEQFYIVWPLLVLLIPAKKISFFIFTLLACFILFTLYNLNDNYAAYDNVHPFSCAISLLTGAILATTKRLTPERLEKWINFAKAMALPAVLGVLIISVSTRLGWLPTSYNIFIRFCMCIIGFFLVGRVTIAPFTGKWGHFLQNKWVMKIGAMSYGVYIWHYLVLILVQAYVYRGIEKLLSNHIFDSSAFHYFKYNTSFIVFPILALMAVATAWLSYTFFEIPFLRLKKYFV